MGSDTFWLKPVAIILAIFIIVALLVEAMPAAFPTVDWATINDDIIAIAPWVIVFGIAIFILMFILRK